MTSSPLPQGFTLMELTLVLLAVLAAAAVPRFIDLSSDAKATALAQFQSAVRGANSQATCSPDCPAIGFVPCPAVATSPMWRVTAAMSRA
ncbi:hypothetical protein [Ferrimonas futtsuensis]|uniref:hypothetical protein n=1 Tax=Ferrimonas futtsuensis TaxID=364764 RepID=UPI0004093F6C|nr:hypothetical protein [Ferrimonas futtsuensis]